MPEGTWLNMTGVMEHHSHQKLQSPEIIDTLHRLKLQPSHLTMGIELSLIESLIGIDMNKSKRSGLELLVQAAKLGRNGTPCLSEFTSHVMF